MPHPLIGKRFRTLVPDMEEDDDYGEVTHPIGSEFTVHQFNHHDKTYGDHFDVLWHHAVNADGQEVDPRGMWTVWSEKEIAEQAVPVVVEGV